MESDLSRITNQYLLDKIDYFVEVQLWPTDIDFNPIGWLSNFDQEDLRLARCLLDRFMLFSQTLTKFHFKAAFQNLSETIVDNSLTGKQARENWDNFISTSAVTIIAGENPNPTDSGYIFARLARQALNIEEDKILFQASAIRYIYSGGCSNIIFVDDFLGSGEQLITTYERTFPIFNGFNKSFSDAHNDFQDINFYYCPIIATKFGLNRIKSMYENISVSPCYLLDSRYSAISDDTIIWPEGYAEEGKRLIEKYSARAQITNLGGFANLGLTLSFYHSVPDATLPLFYWEQNGWIPLVKKR